MFKFFRTGSPGLETCSLRDAQGKEIPGKIALVLEPTRFPAQNLEGEEHALCGFLLLVMNWGCCGLNVRSFQSLCQSLIAFVTTLGNGTLTRCLGCKGATCMGSIGAVFKGASSPPYLSHSLSCPSTFCHGVMGLPDTCTFEIRISAL